MSGTTQVVDGALGADVSTGWPAEGWNLTAVSAWEAWRTVDDASAVVVAIVDSGVYRDHPAFRDVVWKGPEDAIEATIGHGTRVAGIVGGRDGRRPAVRGMARRVTLMPLKIALDGFADRVDVARAVTAIERAVGDGATVVNLSWSSGEANPALERCLSRMADRHPEVLFVTTPGNCDSGRSALEEAPRFPACFALPNTIVVTSTTAEDRLGSASPSSARFVDLAAPGYLITTTATPDVPGGYGLRTGTSFAAPHVSGAAALLKALHPSWGFARLKGHLMASVDRLSALEGLVGSGGRLNLARSVSGPLANLVCDAAGAWTIGSRQRLRWDVAYRSPACTTVDILWSNDGGGCFPTILAADVDNCGEALVTVPAVATTRGRIRVQCRDTRFFAETHYAITTAG